MTTPRAAGWPEMTTWPLPVVAIIGWHNSGKTTVATALVQAYCRRGLRVAAIKHSREDVQLDRPGTDTSLLAEAGAEIVVISSHSRLGWLERPRAEASLAEIIARLPAGIDVAIVEGYKNEETPKVEVLRAGYGHGRIQAPGDLLAVVSDDPTAASDAPVYPRAALDALADDLAVMLGLEPRP
jgi:molybdopterin-guanine dinucleotide biosynthesis protein B